jgi:Zn-dependent protease with chaperone function
MLGLSPGFSMSKCSVCISEGLFSALKSDDELGSILAHELEHTVTGHERESICRDALFAYQYVPCLFAIVLPGGLIAVSGLLFWKRVWLVRGMLMALLPMLPFAVLLTLEIRSREQEADYVGLLLMTGRRI